MADITMTTLNGSTTVIGQEPIDALAASLRGDLLTPDAAGYDEARSIWNAESSTAAWRGTASTTGGLFGRATTRTSCST